MHPRTLVRAAAAALALALLNAPLPTRAADPLELFALIPLTGYGAFFGLPQVQAFRGVENYINRTGGIQGRPLKITVQDDQTNPTVDVQLANDIFAKKVNVMLGPDTVGQCNAVIPLVKTGPVMYCFTTGVHPAAGGYAFASGPVTDYLVGAAFRYLSEKGLKRIATISSIDATGQEGDRMMTAAAIADKSIEIVDRQHFAVNDVSVAAQIAHIKASNPQAVFAWTTGTPFGTVLRGIQESGLDVPVMASSGNLLYDEMKQYAQILPKELLFPGPAFLAPELITDRGVRDAVNVMYAELGAMGAKPDQGHNSNWDAAMLIATVLRKLGPNATPDKIREYLAGLKGWAGVDGRYDFPAEPQRGLGQSSIIVVRWDAAKNTFVGVARPGGIPLRK